MACWSQFYLIPPPIRCRCMVFGHHSSSHCVVASTSRHLYVWDLLTCSGTSVMWVCTQANIPEHIHTYPSTTLTCVVKRILLAVLWCVEAIVELLVADPFSSLVAAFVSMTTKADTSKTIHSTYRVILLGGYSTLYACPVQCTSYPRCVPHLWPCGRGCVEGVYWEQCLFLALQRRQVGSDQCCTSWMGNR